MPITTVFFDLDGTLLPMEQEVFAKAYFGGLAKAAAPYGYEPKALISAIATGTRAMVKNPGEKTNEEVFWDTFAGIYGEEARKDIRIFDEFYQRDFEKVRASCGFTPKAREVISLVKEKGLGAVLATNPLFPRVATESRIRWAGLAPEDFLLFTSYENARHAKPNLDYYRDILAELGLAPEECLMVGNDVGEDMVAEKLGMQVFLLTDHLINRTGEDTSRFPQGGFDLLLEYIARL